MGGFFSSLGAAANALRVFEKALTVTENNVANASTPGYARQSLYLEARPFSLDLGLTGGVEAGQLQSARQEYAEQAVRTRQSSYSRSDELAAELTRIEDLFDVSGEAGIPGSLTELFESISAWSLAPNDTVVRQTVLERARSLASRFQETATALRDASFRTSAQIQNTVNRINDLVAQVRELNVAYREDIRNREDPSLDARLHNTLEELAEYVDFTALRQQDGSVMILLGGQTALVVGDQQLEISADTSGAEAVVKDAYGRDITGQISQGRLAATLEFRNQLIPQLLSGLNRLAAAIADRFNAMLAAGLDRNGQPGAALFTYESAETAAATLEVTDISPDELAAATAAAPSGNGNALDLLALADSPELDGFTFTGFYATLARQVGSALEDVRQDSAQQEQLLMQARYLREQASGVSLDEEAMHLLQFQRSYQAAAKMIQVIDGLLDTLLGLVR